MARAASTAGPFGVSAGPAPPTVSPFACSIRYFYPSAEGVGSLVFWVVPEDGGTDGASGLLTVDGSRIKLSPIGGESAVVPQWDPAAGSAYMAPDGNWLATVPGASGPVRLLCGLSGAEHVRTLPSFPVRFIAGSPAFAPCFSPTGLTQGPLHSGGPIPPGLTSAGCSGSPPVTTSWLAIPTPTGTEGPVGYASQPRGAGWLGATGQLLAPTAMLTAPLPFGSDWAGFPMAPFGGLDPASDSRIAERFEAEVLAPQRLDSIYAAAWPSGGAAGPTGASGPTATLVTPQGLALEVQGPAWTQLTLATSAGQALALANLDPQLAAAFQAEQLFLVIDAPGWTKVKQHCAPLFDALSVGGWLFDMTPGNAAVLIVKFAKGYLPTLAADAGQWTLPDLVTGDAPSAQAAIQAAIDQALSNAGESEYDYFRETVLQDWNGIIALDVTVPANAFPEQLLALTAGMTGPLKAHHFGADLAPVQMANGAPAAQDAKLFGLISYANPGDLTYHGSAYDFKTMSLRVLFANSAVSAFSSKIELLVGQLFAERSVLVGGQNGDNIVLVGALQKHGGSDVYSFTQTGANSFAMRSAVLQSVQVTSAQMLTVPGPTGASGPGGVSGATGATGASASYSALFPLQGTVAFQEQPGFDLFSFGPTGMTGPIGPPAPGVQPDFGKGLRFSNLLVSMTFTEGDQNLADRTFAFDATRATFDLPSSFVRPGSLYDGFPLTATGFLQGGAMPSSMGYLPLETPPLTTGSLGGTWFGIAMDLALGTRGGLAGMAPLTASLLTAWAPGAANAAQPQANVATLAMLPGAKGIKSLGLQGPLKLELGDSSIDWSPGAGGNPAYVMRFNDIALSVFGMKFPSGGRTNVALFGDPAGGRSGSLGWYAAYLKNAPAGGTAPASIVKMSEGAT